MYPVYLPRPSKTNDYLAANPCLSQTYKGLRTRVYQSTSTRKTLGRVSHFSFFCSGVSNAAHVFRVHDFWNLTWTYPVPCTSNTQPFEPRFIKLCGNLVLEHVPTSATETTDTWRLSLFLALTDNEISISLNKLAYLKSSCRCKKYFETKISINKLSWHLSDKFTSVTWFLIAGLLLLLNVRDL